jgi:biopolymer transport protein ExbD
MRRMRRTSPDVRVEITPMIDVVFLLLTFFIFSIVLMVRADVLNVQLPELSSGQTAEAVVPITVVITESGDILVNRIPVESEAVIQHLTELQAEIDSAPIVLAVDTNASAGVLLELVDRLTGAGIDSFSIIGERAESEVEPSESP